MELDNNILALIEPSIQPKKIETPSFEEGNGETDKVSKTFGIDQPVIFMNNYKFEKTDILQFELSNSGFLPTCDVTIVDTKNVFAVDAFPRDGDNFTVFINSKNESTFKSIHMDFEVLNIAAVPKKEGDPKKISISGRVKIPRIFSENCQFLEENTSIEHIKKVSEELGLGLASNITETTDPQVRIQAYINYVDFIGNIVKSSYVSDDSFQTHFVDPYYYLNFIDVNRILNSKNLSLDELQDNMTSLNTSMAEENHTDESIDSTETKLILTNNVQLKPTNQYIAKYEIENKSNIVVEAHGHFRDVQIYDDNAESPDERLDEFTVEALSANAENLKDIEEPLKGNRESEEYSSLIKHKYMGRQDVGTEGLGNVHQNHIFSQLHNIRNIDETQKLKLKITLESFNPSLYRFQKIPVLLYHTDSRAIKGAQNLEEAKKDKGFTDSSVDIPKSDEKEPDQMLDQFLSGYYLIESIDIVYRMKRSNFYQEVTLIRREWPARMSAVNSINT